MHPFDELLAYVGFGDDDSVALGKLRPHVSPHARRIADRFYEIVLRFPGAVAVFADVNQVERLKVTLVRWIDEMLSGPYDLDYYDQRRRIGQVHVRVGLPQQYMFTAMNRLMEEVHDILATVDDPTLHKPTAARALRRMADIELAIMLGTYVEAREKKGLESLRDLLISHLPTAVLLIDKDGRVATSTTPWNEVFARGEIGGLPLAEALHAAIFEKAQLAQHLERARTTGHEIVVPRVDVEFGDRSHTLRVAVIPLQHPLADALVHIEDLTDTLASEARAKQAEHLARLGTMAASVAHEIRNPLAGISGTVQVIAMSLPDGDNRRGALSKVQDQIQRLGNLVGDLLSFSRPITPQCRDVDLVGVVRNAAAEAEAATGGAASIEGSGTGLADAQLLGQVLLNLIQNAFQAGAKRVVVEVSNDVVGVFDDGPGVSEADRGRIFEPFFTTKIRGTGLGLPVARKMIEAMRGSLDLTSSRLGGAGFVIRLPDDR